LRDEVIKVIKNKKKKEIRHSKIFEIDDNKIQERNKRLVNKKLRRNN